MIDSLDFGLGLVFVLDGFDLGFGLDFGLGFGHDFDCFGLDGFNFGFVLDFGLLKFVEWVFRVFGAAGPPA